MILIRQILGAVFTSSDAKETDIVPDKYRKVEAPKCNNEPQMDWNFETRGIFEPVQNSEIQSCTPSKVEHSCLIGFWEKYSIILY